MSQLTLIFLVLFTVLGDVCTYEASKRDAKVRLDEDLFSVLLSLHCETTCGILKNKILPN
jgi:hypothetical protein